MGHINREHNNHSKNRIRETNPNKRDARGKQNVLRPREVHGNKYTQAAILTESTIGHSYKGIKSCHIPDLSDKTLVTPSPKLTLYGESGGDETSSILSTTRLNVQIKKHLLQKNGHTSFIPGHSRQVSQPSENNSRQISTKRSREPIQTQLQSDDRFPKDLASWKRLKGLQQKSQQRAFVRHSDNPFKNYKHDPNDTESYLDHLSSHGKEETSGSIIPPEGLHALATTSTIPIFGSRNEHYRTILSGHPRSRKIYDGPALSIPDFLSQKAAESNFHSMATSHHTLERSPSRYPYADRAYHQAFQPNPSFHWHGAIIPSNTNTAEADFNGISPYDKQKLYHDAFDHRSSGKHPLDGHRTHTSVPPYTGNRMRQPGTYECGFMPNYEGQLDSQYYRSLSSSYREPHASYNRYTGSQNQFIEQDDQIQHGGFRENDIGTSFF
jgi:hypothetical protein